jgi:phosphoribosylformylglycinamidine cyclo-ligase
MKLKTKKRTSTKTPRTYAEVVSYEALDPLKILGQRLGSETSEYISATGVTPCEEFRGESAAVFELPNGSHMSHVEEGLGTAQKLADSVYAYTGDAEGYNVIMQSAVGAIVNDLATTGVPPISIQMHLAAGDEAYIQDMRRVTPMMHGWQKGCRDSKAVWSGGETPILKETIFPGTCVVAGSAVGWLSNLYNPFRENIAPGDIIVGLASSGLHINGITLFRRICGDLPDKRGIKMFKKALVPAVNYVHAVRTLIATNLPPNYVINVTGHGWRKIMRAKPEFTYVIEKLPPIHPIFRQFQKLGKIKEREMWENYNMGIGYAFIFSASYAGSATKVLRKAGYKAHILGYVKKGKKQVYIEPLKMRLAAHTLKIR